MLVYNDYWDKLRSGANLLNQYEWNINEDAREYNEELFQKAYETFAQRFEGIEKENTEKHEYIRQCYEAQYEIIADAIPDAIKRDIADLRLLVLGTITNEIYQRLLENARQADNQLIAMEEAYQKNLETVKEQIPEDDFDIAYAGYHDAFVIDCGCEDNNLYLILRLDRGLDNFHNLYTKVIYENAVLIEGNWSSNLYVWIYNEIYYTEDKIELHIRFSGGDVILRTDKLRKETYYSIFASEAPLEDKKNEEVFYGNMEEFIQAGHAAREESINHPLREHLGDEAFEKMNFMWSKYDNSFGKLEVHESPYKEYFYKITGRKYIYEPIFENSWTPDKTNSISKWTHGEEIMDYIIRNCKNDLEIWSLWSDNLDFIERREIKLSNLRIEDIEALYKETKDGIAKSYQVIIKNC